MSTSGSIRGRRWQPRSKVTLVAATLGRCVYADRLPKTPALGIGALSLWMNL